VRCTGKFLQVTSLSGVHLRLQPQISASNSVVFFALASTIAFFEDRRPVAP
jgi:hypothetical protein